jgi:hypothetical protein
MEVSTLPTQKTLSHTPVPSPRPAEEPQSAFKKSTAPSFAQALEKASAPIDVLPVARSKQTRELCDWLMKESSLQPQWADKWAHDYAYDSLGLLALDISDDPILRVSATGEIYTPEIELYYESLWKAWQPGRVQLYEAEVKKGTSGIEILEKILAYNDTLPPELRRLSGW